MKTIYKYVNLCYNIDTEMKISAGLYKTYLWFFSNVISLNNAQSPYPPTPFPKGEGGEFRALRALNPPFRR